MRRKHAGEPQPGDAKAAIEGIFSKIRSVHRLRQANETSTRVEVIDAVLAALGWPAKEIHREVPSGTGDFLDYELHVGGVPWMLVEAKRIGQTFDFAAGPPSESGTKNLRPMLSTGGSALREVLKQGAKYSNDRAIPIACATNGFQWIFFRGLSSRDRRWVDGVALVFASPNEIIAGFDRFWGALGRPWVGKPYLSELLDRKSKVPLPAPRIPRDFLDLQRSTSDSATQALLRSINDQLLGEIYGEHRQDMLRRCYVQPGIVGEFERTVQRLLKDSETPIVDDAQVAAHGTTDAFVAELTRQDKLSNIRQPVLVVGHVGAGKSTFLQRTLDEFRSGRSAFCAVVDLEGQGQGEIIDSSREEHRVAEQTLSKLGRAAATVLRHRADLSDGARLQADPSAPETLRTILRVPIEQEKRVGARVWNVDPPAWARKEYELFNELRARPVDHLIAYIRHVGGRFTRTDGIRYPTLIVLDNVDLGSNEYQKCIYGLANRIARDTRAVVVLSLREDTYLTGREKDGFLSSSTLPFVFHIAAPSMGHLLRQRVQFAAYAIDHRLLPTALVEERATIESVCRLIEATLLQQRSESLELLAALAGHNMRSALDLVRGLVEGSTAAKARPSSSAAYAFECLLMSMGREGLKARFRVANCFDSAPSSPPFHALRLRLLAFFASAFDSMTERPFLEAADCVLGRFSAWGYPVASVRASLRALLDDGLLRPHDRSTWDDCDPEAIPARITISSAGYAHLSRLVQLRAYRAAMGTITRWYDEELADKFIVAARAAGAAEGPTVADIAESAAVEFFDAYLAQEIEREDASLVRALDARAWVADIRSRSARILPQHFAAPVWVDTGTDGVPSPPPSSKQMEMSFSRRKRPSLLPIARTAETKGTVWIPRILWALEWARRAGLAGRTAAQIARILCEHGEVDVPGENVARAFRDLKTNGKADGLWRVTGHRYEIADKGILLLTAILREQEGS